MKIPALQNKQVVVLRLAFRARKVLGTFEKRAPDLCDADAVFHQLGYQVIMWVYDKPVDIGYKCDVIDHTRILSIGRELACNGG